MVFAKKNLDMELTRAYFAQQKVFDELDVSDYLNELDDDDCVELCGKTREEVVSMIPEIAMLSRKKQNDYGYAHCDAIEFAVCKVFDAEK